MNYRPPICPPQSAGPIESGSNLFTKLWWLFFRALAIAIQQPLVRQGTREDRLALLAADVFDATLFTETDTGLIYQARTVDGVSSWYYVSGVYALPQGSIVAFWSNPDHPLGETDAGLLIDSTDYFHRYRWDGAACDFAPGDPGSGYIVAAAPDPPAGALWGLCDGSDYGVAQPNGVIDTLTSPDLTGDVAILGAATPDAASRAAASPTWAGGSKTDDESNTHTHPYNLGGANSYAAGAFPAYPGGTGSTGTEDATHHHDLTDGNAVLNPPSEGDGGLGLRYALSWYIRR